MTSCCVLWYNHCMFTGIIEEIGRIEFISSDKIGILCQTVIENTKIGDSVSVNGICLTVCKISDNGFTADISPETKKVTNLNDLKSGDFVNLERAMPADGRFGGHIVSGHIDSRGKCVNVTKIGNFYNLKIEVPNEYAKYVIKKGSISINGISLTIADVNKNIITIAVIPHTFENTNLQYLSKDNFVNVEVDMCAKYIEKFLSTDNNKTGIDSEFLHENGFL